MLQLKQSPNEPMLHHLLGRIYITTNDLNSAEESLKKAINLKNDLVGAYIDLGDIYSKRVFLKMQ